MALLGDWNWYLPAWLDWLPRLQVEEAVSLEPPTPATITVTGAPGGLN